MIKLYGITRSRASRCLWMLEELGVPYERERVGIGPAGSHDAAFIAVNPNGKLPALVDDGLVLWESLAINLYLADKYGKAAGGGLWPKSPEDRGRCYMWSLWAVTEAEPEAHRALRHRYLLPEAQRVPEEYERAVTALAKPVAVLNGALAGRPYLLGDAFTVADLNVAVVLSWAYRVGMSLDGQPTVKDWADRCLARPAYHKVNEMRRAES